MMTLYEMDTTRELREAREVIQEQKRSLLGWIKQNKMQEEQLKEQSTQLKEQSTRMEEKDTQLEEKNTQLEEKDIQIEELRARLAKYESIDSMKQN